jgi:hypothetical protein
MERMDVPFEISFQNENNDFSSSQQIAESSKWNEFTLTVLNRILDKNIALDNEILQSLVIQLDEHAETYKSEAKFAKLLFVLLSKYKKQVTRLTIECLNFPILQLSLHKETLNRTVSKCKNSMKKALMSKVELL